MPPRTRTVRYRLARSFGLALVLIGALALPSHALGAAWVAAQTVTENPPDATAPPVAQVAVDGLGNAVLAMAVAKGPPKFVQVATRPGGGSWSAAQQLGPVVNGGGPTLAVDPAGDALVVFVNTTTTTAPCVNGTSCLQIWAKPAGSSTWTNEKLVSAPAGTAFIDPSVALDPRGNGNATIVWWRTPTAGLWTVEAMQRAAGAWGSTQTVQGNTSDNLSSTHVVIDGNGTPVALWAGTLATCPNPCSYALHTSAYSGTWANANVETNSSDQYDANAADISETLDGQGRALAIWLRTNATTAAQRIEGAVHPLTTAAAWQAPVPIYTPPATDSITAPKLVLAADGDGVAAWNRSSGAGVPSIEAAVLPAGGSFGAPQTLDANPNDFNGPALAIDAAGNDTLIWRNGTSSTVRFAVRPHGGSFGAAQDAVAAGGGGPIAAADPAGNVTAAWTSSTTTVQTEVYDAAPPILQPLAAPALSYNTGSSIDFAASATDLWSGPLTYHWDFGDGSAADGATTSHAFGAPGTYQPKVVASDAAGNSSSQTEAITVANPSSPPPPPPLPDPVVNKTVNVVPVSGVVLVKVPGSSSFAPLTSPKQIQVGSIIDARKGRVRITIANGHGGFDTAEFYEGVFLFTQPKVKAGQTAFADLFLVFGSFRGCPSAPKNPKIAALAKAKSTHRSIRHLWGSGQGAFRTVGRFSSATVRGTTWLTDDRCDGTLTKVTAGKVGVRDFVLRKTILVKKGHSYFARPKRS